MRGREPNFLFLFGGMIVLLVTGPVVDVLFGRSAVIFGQFALSAIINILTVVVLVALVLRLQGWQRRAEAAYA